MAITFVGTSSGDQGLFNRLGKIGGTIDAVNAFRGAHSSGDLPQYTEDLMALFDGCSEVLRDYVSPAPANLAGAQAGLGGYLSGLQAIAQSVLIGQVDADSLLPSLSLDDAFAALLHGMNTAGYYVSSNTIGAALTKTSLTGNGTVVVSLKDGLGRNLENLLAETILITVTDDSTPRNETLQFAGQRAEPDRLSHLWPAGSGATLSVASNPAAASIVSNSDFETFTTPNVPDGWSVVTGTPGTNILSSTSPVYAGAKALKFVGDSSTLQQITFPLTGLMLPQTNYAFCIALKLDTVPAAGVLVFDLYNGSTIISDQAGTANSITWTVSVGSTSWTLVTGSFRLPDPLPTTVLLRMRLSTAISSGSNLWADELRLVQMQQLDPAQPGSTPFVSVMSGSTGFVLSDGGPGTTFTLATTNNRNAKFQQLFDRLLATSSANILLPIAGSTAISDSLIA